MNTKIIAGLVFILIGALLGLIASDFSEGSVMAGLSTRKLLAGFLLLTVVLFDRFRRRRTKKDALMRQLQPVENSETGNSSLKPLYLTLAVVAAAGCFFVPKATWPGVSILIAVSLMGAFLSKEQIEDERVEHLKLKAITAAFAGAFLLVFLHTWWIGVQRGSNGARQFLTAFDMIIATMLIALGLFHYWRWQDGRGERVK